MKKFLIGFCAMLMLNIMGEPILIEYFFQPGCEECENVNAFVLPRLIEEYQGRYDLRRYDIGIVENYKKLAALQEILKVETNDAVCMVIGQKIYLGGYRNIDQRLLAELQSFDATRKPSAPEPDQSERIQRFTLGAVIVAGLIDGINPCVFATLVFFFSLLAVSKINGTKLLLVGSAYCLACFLTYLALGFGLLLLYNFMFILPLLVLFIAAWRGVTTSVFINWSKKNVLWEKIALGCFFLMLALLMILFG